MPKLERIDPSLLASNPRASFAAWMKYRDIVEVAYNKHPVPHRFEPANLAAATVTSRIRESVRGAIAFEYPGFCSPADLTRWWSETVVKQNGKEVIIGPAEQVAEAVKVKQATPSSTSSGYFYDTLDFEQIAAFCCLISGGLIQGPVVVKAPPDLDLLTDRPNVELMKKPDGSIIIL